MNSYEAKKAEKAARYREYAENAKKRSDSHFGNSRDLVKHIPLGQPILVGHHSEGRHRRTLERTDNQMRKSIEESEKSKYWEARAEAIENNNNIYKQDPEAVQKLQEQIDLLENIQNRMKQVNAYIRKKKLTSETENVLEELKELKLSNEEIQIIFFESLHYERLKGIGFPSYKLNNNRQNLNRLKKRLESLKREKSREAIELEVNNHTIIENEEQGGIELYFPGIPSEKIRKKLKINGWKWAPRKKCWYVRKRNDYWLNFAKEIAESEN